MGRLYFGPDGETCFPKAHFVDHMRMYEQTSIDVCEAIRVTDSPFMFCKDSGDSYEKGGCGVVCNSYNPKNGKSGACKHLGSIYTHGARVTLRIKANSQ